MDLTFTPEQDQFRARVRAFLEENVAQSGLGELPYFPTLPKIELNCRSEGRSGRRVGL